jgi:hypothetical protein
MQGGAVVGQKEAGRADYLRRACRKNRGPDSQLAAVSGGRSNIIVPAAAIRCRMPGRILATPRSNTCWSADIESYHDQTMPEVE